MTSQMNVGRAQVLERLRSAFEPLPHVHAMWEGGAAAFGRVDEWSDIDLQVVADDDRVAEIFPVAESALESLSPISLRYELPQPTWHGHHQCVYRLRDASPFLLIDFVVMKFSAEDKFVQPELHGDALVHFDRAKCVHSDPLDADLLRDKLTARLQHLQLIFELFQILTLKEVHRGHDLEALTYYHTYTLRPLVEVLRIQHQPARHAFHTRYLQYDLPAPLVEKVRSLHFVSDLEDLARKREEAERLFREATQNIDWDELSA